MGMVGRAAVVRGQRVDICTGAFRRKGSGTRAHLANNLDTAAPQNTSLEAMALAAVVGGVWAGPGEVVAAPCAGTRTLLSHTAGSGS